MSFGLQSSRVFSSAAIALLMIWTILGFSACVFEDFDEPPVRGLTNLQPNTDIATVKALHTLGSDATPIPSGQIIEAVVGGNDISGNIFKELYVQDATGGLVIRIDVTGLNGLYPVGTRVIIRLDGLFIGDFNNKYQLTVADGERLPEALMRESILFKSFPSEVEEVEPTVITIADLEDPATFDRLLSTLVAFDDLQFIDSDSGAPFADVPGDQDLNRTLRDCFGNEIVTRTSRFSDFAGNLTPTGNGRVVALLDVFGTTRQLKIRELADFNLTGDRCDITVGGELITLGELREQFSGATTSVSANTKIRGIVISDNTTNNLNGQNLFLQDGDAGIVVRFTDDHTFARGTDLEIAVSGLELSEFNGLLQINNVPLSNAADQGAATLPTPRETTVAEVQNNADAWESTLVKLTDATITGAATLGNNLTVDDGTGNISMFTFSSATFANEPVPSGEVDVTAIVSDFNGVQIVIRDADDIEGGMTGSGDLERITATELRTLFEGGATSAPADRFLQGVAVSDDANGNTNNQNLIVQDGEGGIVVRFSSAHGVSLNEEVMIDVSSMELSEFNGLLQVNNVPNANLTEMGQTAPPSPRVATIQEIIDNAEVWESTVVQIEDATFSGNTVFDGTVTITDATGNFGAFVRSQATFNGSSVPSGTLT
ncbi:MAG: DUF5689 domain-containing protein, partial [Bacteroidota bacterium]